MDLIYLIIKEDIVKVNVVKKTETGLHYIDSDGLLKFTCNTCFDTFKEAKKALVGKFEKSIERAIYAKETAEDKLYMVSQLKEK